MIVSPRYQLYKQLREELYNELISTIGVPITLKLLVEGVDVLDLYKCTTPLYKKQVEAILEKGASRHTKLLKNYNFTSPFSEGTDYIDATVLCEALLENGLGNFPVLSRRFRDGRGRVYPGTKALNYQNPLIGYLFEGVDNQLVQCDYKVDFSTKK